MAESKPQPQAVEAVQAEDRSERSRAGSMTGVNRVVLLAVDASENAKNAFDCEYTLIYITIILSLLNVGIIINTVIGAV